MKSRNILYRVMMVALLPAAVILIFGILSKGRTLSARMLLITLQQSVKPAIIAMGVIGHVTLGMWDFSAGGVILAASIIGGNLMKLTDTGILGLFVFCLLLGVALSSLTGYLNNKLNVPLLVLTIGLIFIYESFPRILFPRGITIRDKFTTMASMPYNFVILAIMAMLFHVIYNKTAYGHNIRALGGGADIAKAAGINAKRIRQLGFTTAGVFLGVAAFMNISENGQILNVAALESSGMVFSALLSVFLANFMGRYCSMSIALIIGSFTMQMLSNGFVALGLPHTMQDITTGVFLLLLIAITSNEQRFKQNRENKIRARRINLELASQ